MKNSSKLGYTASSSSAQMVSSGDFTHAYLFIVQTTQKSEFRAMHSACNLHRRLDRILLAGIRNMGQCPCPRCRTPLDRVHQLGMPRDMTIRANSIRVDDVQRKSLVMSARRVIYQTGLIVNSAAVENLLKDLSLVPNKVCPRTVVLYYG